MNKEKKNTNVFVSFHHELNQKHANVIRRMITELGYNDISVNDGIKIEDEDSKTDEKIRQEIRDKFLREVDVTILIVGSDSVNRKHLDWEIRSTLHKFDDGRNGSIVVINALQNRESWILDNELIALHDNQPAPAKRSWPDSVDEIKFEWLPFRLRNSIINNYDKRLINLNIYNHAIFPIILYDETKNSHILLDRAIQHSLEMIKSNKGKWDLNEKMMRQNRENASRPFFEQVLA